jgi:hypothetical protein
LVDKFGVSVIVLLAVVAPVVVARTRDEVLVRVGRLGSLEPTVVRCRTGVIKERVHLNPRVEWATSWGLGMEWGRHAVVDWVRPRQIQHLRAEFLVILEFKVEWRSICEILRLHSEHCVL